MKNIPFLLFAVCLMACTNRSSVIEGRLPNDSYNNEWVYWVPMKGASAKTVDSTRIHKNVFHLAISAHNRNRTGIVRVRPPLRLALQDILVFTEAGTVQVQLDSVSSAAGTPLNEVLQNWKDKKQTYDKEIYALKRKLRTTDPKDEAEIKKEIENVSAAYHKDVYQIIAENKANEIGKFLYSLHKAFFTTEQIQGLGMEE